MTVCETCGALAGLHKPTCMDPRPNTLGKPSTRREPMVSVARIEAAIKLLYPEDMTPQAKNVLERILEEGN